MATISNVRLRSRQPDAGFQNRFPGSGQGGRLLEESSRFQQISMPSSRPIVFIVDGDPRVRETLSHLLAPLEHGAATFGSVAEFLAFEKPDRPGCLLLDLDLLDTSGLKFQQRLASGNLPPVVFITEHGDVSSCVRAMKSGATDILQKPFSEQHLRQAIAAAIALDRAAWGKRSELAELRKHYALLTPREREVLPFVAAGLLNKQTAFELGTSEITIRVHRGQIMRKMAARSLAELVRIVDKLGVQFQAVAPSDLRSPS